MTKQKITPFLWFDRNAEKAMKYYCEVFDDARILSVKYYPDDMQVGPQPDMGGKVLTAVFELAGQQFMCLDGGDYFKFNEAISLFVSCKDQAEIDYYWEKLSAVPESEQCGWCKDKFGVSWQIVPDSVEQWMNNSDNEKAGRAMQAMLKMKKIVIADLEAASK